MLQYINKISNSLFCSFSALISDLCNGIPEKGPLNGCVCVCVYCERKKHPRGFDIKCGTANLQRQRLPYGVWIVQRDHIVGTCYESRRKDF